jgi:hypothetical protein
MKSLFSLSAPVTAVAAFVTLSGFVLPDVAAAACLSAGEARRAVASGEAVRLGEIAGMVDGDIVNAELCERGRRLVYELAVIRGGGRVVTVIVDAQTGTVLR